MLLGADGIIGEFFVHMSIFLPVLFFKMRIKVLFALMILRAGNNRYGHVTGEFQDCNRTRI